MKRLFILILFVIALLPPKNKAQSTTGNDLSNLAGSIFHTEFNQLGRNIVRDHYSSIYEGQIIIQNLLHRAILDGDYMRIDSIAAIYLHALRTLKPISWYPLNTWKNHDSVYLGREYLMWLFPKNIHVGGVSIATREEYHLSSSQFLFAVAQIIHACASVPPGQFSNIDTLIELYTPIVLEHHYKRWILKTRSFRLSGWGCVQGSFNHQEFLTLKRRKKFWFKPTICPIVTDVDLFIISGLALMMDAQAKHPDKIKIPQEDLIAYQDYLKDADKLLKDRIQYRKIDTKEGTIDGFAFDNGRYKDYKDQLHAAYTGEEFPISGTKIRASSDATWDVSHARRFYFVFYALEQTQKNTGMTIDFQRTLQALANQFYYVIYSDTTRLLFSNYMNGDNGWYRVGYHGDGFGYPPYSQSMAILEGGWFFLGRYKPAITELGNNMWKTFQRDPENYNRYYGVMYKNFQPIYRKFSTDPDGSEKLMMLQWLPSI